MPDRKSPSGLMAATVHPLDKGIGGLDAPCAPEEIAARGWNLFGEDLSLPAAVLSQPRLEHNLAWMQRFAAEYGVQLAPQLYSSPEPTLLSIPIVPLHEAPPRCGP